MNNMNDDLPNWPIVVREAYLKVVHSGSSEDLQNFLRLRREWLNACLDKINSPRVVDKVYEDVHNDKERDHKLVQ
jgi:hypothetical protein